MADDNLRKLGPNRLPPGNWGNDSVTSYLDTARENQCKAYVSTEAEVGRLIVVDGCFKLLTENWTDPSPMVPAFLGIRSHSAFRASCLLALSGASAEVFTLVRTCIEYAAYALVLYKQPDKEAVWLNRHAADDGVKAVRNSFLAKDVEACIRSVSPAKEIAYKAIYDFAIDFGAHPNVYGLSSSMSIKGAGDERTVTMTYLNETGIHLKAGMVYASRAGLCALGLLQEIFPVRFKEAGLTAILAKMEPLQEAKRD